ncbi:MAG TPA: ATP-binding protein [Actinomycetota bacterium]|jgi:anti-sigma regulatory factor (Ser/Thr protein kinase)
MLEFERVLPAVPDSIPVARHLVDSLRGTIDDAVLEDLRLLVSEIVTNSIRHGPGSQVVDLRVSVDEARVRVEVEDRGRGFDPRPRETISGDAGWGLVLVDRLADRWGVEVGATTIVWFEIDRRGPRPVVSA